MRSCVGVLCGIGLACSTAAQPTSIPCTPNAEVPAVVAPASVVELRDGFRSSSPEHSGLDDTLLAAFLDKAKAESSTSLVIAMRARDPRVVGDNPKEFGWYDFVWDALALAGHTIAKDDRNAFAGPVP